MTQMNTDQLLQAALERVGMTEAPPDSVIYQRGTRISHILVGLEIGVAELFMARQLGYHGVLSYRPCGYPGFGWAAYERHRDRMQTAGVPRNVAEGAIQPGLARLQYLASQANPDHAPSVARLVDLPFLVIHTPFAEQARITVEETVRGVLAYDSDATAGDVREALLELPAFGSAPEPLLAPRKGWDVLLGKTAVALGAYAPPDATIARAYFAHGIDTLVCADFAPEEQARLDADGVSGNIIRLGEWTTARLGAAPYVAELRAQGIEVTLLGGLGV